MSIGGRASHRYWLRVALLVLLLVSSASLLLWADRLSTARLLERATRHWPPEFREANSKALVAAYIILGEPLDELEEAAGEAIREYGTYELWNALVAGRRGDYIDICYHPQEVENIFVRGKGRHLEDLSDEELLEIATLGGYTARERRAAATLLVKRAIAEAGARAGIEIRSWWAFREPRDYELHHFDPLKLKLQGWMWYSDQAPELAAATITPLAQMYLAEHFAWWEQDARNPGRGRYHRIIQSQLECPGDE